MALDLRAAPANEVLCVAFNQDCTSFACGTETGIRVYNTDPFGLIFRRDFEDETGVGVLAMLYRSHILAFSGGGQRPRVQPHQVVIWDEKQARNIAELSFASLVLSVKLCKELVVVAVEKKVYVYGFRTVQLFDTIDTAINPKGLCCLAVASDRIILVTPGPARGRARVIFYLRNVGAEGVSTAREKTMVVPAHDSTISAMAVDFDGQMLATSSEMGTIIRVWDIGSWNSTCEKILEVRRGADRADIHSLAFSPDAQFMAAASGKGTIHVFALAGGAAASVSGAPDVVGGVDLQDHGDSFAPLQPKPGKNSKSSLQQFKCLLPAYFASEWSLAQFRVPDCRCIAAFGSEPNTVVVACANGSYFKARFDPARGGEMRRVDFAQFGGEDVGVVEVALPDPEDAEAAAAAARGRSGSESPLRVLGESLAASNAFFQDDGDDQASVAE